MPLLTVTLRVTRPVVLSFVRNYMPKARVQGDKDGTLVFLHLSHARMICEAMDFMREGTWWTCMGQAKYFYYYTHWGERRTIINVYPVTIREEYALAMDGTYERSCSFLGGDKPDIVIPHTGAFGTRQEILDLYRKVVEEVPSLFIEFKDSTTLEGLKERAGIVEESGKEEDEAFKDFLKTIRQQR